MRLIVILAVILVIPAVGLSATIKVPGDYPTIQQAIDAAVNGDTVLVDPGTYMENINFIGKAITVNGEKGPDVTEIDGPLNYTVIFKSGEGNDTILDGFTIKNPQYGIQCRYSSPIIRNNHFRECIWGAALFNSSVQPLTFKNNIITKNGYGIQVFKCDNAIILNNIFTENNGWSIEVTYSANSYIDRNIVIGNSGGVYCDTGTTVSNNIIIHNSGGGGIYVRDTGEPKIINNIICGNSASRGGGIWCGWQSVAEITNNTIAYNTASNYGGGIAGETWDTVIKNSIIWGNTPSQIDLLYVPVTYCDVEGGFSGTGNIDKDPIFLQGPKGFYYLSQTAAGQPTDSPCVDTGSDLASNLGMDVYWTRTDGVADSGIVDMGFHYGDFFFPSLQTDTFQIQESTGGDAEFLLLAGTGNANRNYILLGSVTGTDPGIPLPGGKATLPINWDILTNTVINFANTPPFLNFVGKLDSSGSANAAFNTLGPIPGSTGMNMHFAFALNGPWDFASNPVGIEIVQ